LRHRTDNKANDDHPVGANGLGPISAVSQSYVNNPVASLSKRKMKKIGERLVTFGTLPVSYVSEGILIFDRYLPAITCGRQAGDLHVIFRITRRCPKIVVFL
jgi:hypothetical protein